MFEQIRKDKRARKIVEKGKWPIGRKTVHRKELAPGDKVLLYRAGDGAKEFFGACRLLSYLLPEEQSIFDYVAIGNVKIWKRPVPIRKLLDRLQFVKDKNHWGLYLKGGVIAISENDYRFVLQRVGSERTSSLLAPIPR